MPYLDLFSLIVKTHSQTINSYGFCSTINIDAEFKVTYVPPIVLITDNFQRMRNSVYFNGDAIFSICSSMYRNACATVFSVCVHLRCFCPKLCRDIIWHDLIHLIIFLDINSTGNSIPRVKAITHWLINESQYNNEKQNRDKNQKCISELFSATHYPTTSFKKDSYFSKGVS